MSRDLLKPGRALVWASAIMMASVTLSRVMGMAREMVIAAARGAGASVDAYQIAFILPDLLNHVVAGGFFSVTFIPILARYLTRGEMAEGWRVASLVLTLSTLVAALLAAVAWLFAPALLPLVAPHRSAPFLDEATRLTRIMIPAQACFIPGGVLMAVQMARGRFLLPGLAPLLYNGGIIIGGLLTAAGGRMEGFCWGVVAGALLGNFGLQIWGARRAGLRFRPCFQVTHPDLRTYVLLTLPLALGLTMTFSTEFFFKYFGAWLGEGAIACLNYALRLTLVLVAVSGQAAGTASYPFLAALAAAGRLAELHGLLAATLRRVVGPVLLGSTLVAVLAPEVVRLVYQHGRFGAASIQPTAQALRGFLVGAFAWAGFLIVVRGWYALRNTLVPALVGTGAVLLSVPVYAVFTRWWGPLGVALGCSTSVVLQAVVLHALWNRKAGARRGRETYARVLRAALLATLLGGGAVLLKCGLAVFVEPASFGGALAIVTVVGAGFVTGTVLLAPRFGLEEVRDLRARALGRLRRRGRAPRPRSESVRPPGP